ncbi:hemolysin family protein [Halorussus gelatinilyticus]|uniref:Hemolysin family protein n=1 Tax=Halorussus gelatinilyticus TaxID=2937524 RepID=A0A8U0IHA4_9EURY|nr:hemolysin family protein [Halorussus gelatinilyticus]UPW00363.1 hemolysin family protein [Halorussus gelatinilyticus]
MVDLVFSAARIVLALFLVVLNGFFVATEFAFVRIRSTTVESLVEEGAPGASTLQAAIDNLDDYLAVTQLGITIASLGLGWIGEPAVAAVLEPVIGPFLPTNLVHLVSFAVGFGLITFLHVVFGELAPKTIAIARAERVSLLAAPPMKFFYYLFVPGIIVFNGTANAFTRLLGVPPVSETEESLEEEELLMVLARSGKQGHIDKAEVEMIERVFDLDDITVREVMVPRPDVVSAPADLPLSDLRTLIIEEGHTRYPVVKADDSNQVVGYVDAKDVLEAIDPADGASASVTASDLARDLPVVPETGRINDLLSEFQDQQGQMAAVIDEWGSFEGIVTVEDLVEVVVGDLRDEFDVDHREPSIDRRSDGSFSVDGGVAVSEVNERLNADFEVADFDTLGGLVLDRLGRAPEVGDRIETDGYYLDVDEVDGARVSTVAVRERDAPGDGDGERGDDTATGSDGPDRDVDVDENEGRQAEPPEDERAN